MTARYDCRVVVEQQPALDLVSKYESHDCPGGAWVGTGSSVAHAPPLAVLFGHLRGKLSSQNPFDLCVFDCGECGWENRSGADNGTFFRVGRFSP